MSAYLSYRHCHTPNAITSKPPKVKRKGILQSSNISVKSGSTVIGTYCSTRIGFHPMQEQAKDM